MENRYSLRKLVRNVIEETFLTADTIRTMDGKDIYTEIFINPSAREIRSLIDTTKIIRLALDDNGDLYAWHGKVGHYEMLKYVKKNFKIALSYNDTQKTFINIHHYPDYLTPEVLMEFSDDLLEHLQDAFPQMTHLGQPGRDAKIAWKKTDGWVL